MRLPRIRVNKAHFACSFALFRCNCCKILLTVCQRLITACTEKAQSWRASPKNAPYWRLPSLLPKRVPRFFSIFLNYLLFSGPRLYPSVQSIRQSVPLPPEGCALPCTAKPCHPEGGERRHWSHRQLGRADSCPVADCSLRNCPTQLTPG